MAENFVLCLIFVYHFYESKTRFGRSEANAEIVFKNCKYSCCQGYLNLYNQKEILRFLTMKLHFVYQKVQPIYCFVAYVNVLVLVWWKKHSLLLSFSSLNTPNTQIEIHLLSRNPASLFSNLPNDIVSGIAENHQRTQQL